MAPISSWLDELQALDANALPPAARRAVANALDCFEAEDGSLPAVAEEARKRLSSPGVPYRPRPVLAPPDRAPSPAVRRALRRGAERPGT